MILLYFFIAFVIMFCVLLLPIQILNIKHAQRVKLMVLYSELYFVFKQHYKKRNRFFRQKEDFFYFKNAIGWVKAYMSGDKNWESLSDEEMGRLAARIFKADEKYDVPVASLLKKYRSEILLRSLFLIAPWSMMFRSVTNQEPFKQIKEDLRKDSNKETVREDKKFKVPQPQYENLKRSYQRLVFQYA